MAAKCAISESDAGNIYWLMTELQGGNKTYSGYEPMCPTKEEIAQWHWTVIGIGGKGAIFWSLNPLGGKYEAGECLVGWFVYTALCVSNLFKFRC